MLCRGVGACVKEMPHRVDMLEVLTYSLVNCYAEISISNDKFDFKSDSSSKLDSNDVTLDSKSNSSSNDDSKSDLDAYFQSNVGARTWQLRYVVLLWLSIVVRVPFSLAAIDSGHDLVRRLVDVGRRYLDDRGPAKVGAAEMLARLLTRPDVRDAPLDAFLAFAERVLADADDGNEFVEGTLMCVARMVKHGERLLVLRKIEPRLFERCMCLQRSARRHRVLLLKTVRRFALAVLAPLPRSTQHPWAYRPPLHVVNKEASRASSSTAAMPAMTMTTTMDAQLESIEDAIDILLQSLDDEETTVRWNAAKGVGRVVERLPVAMAEDVVLALLSLFDAARADANAWHGACLALAELVRRGLLLPKRLGDVVPLVVSALTFEQRSGAMKIGAHVRDAACYVCWALARCYDKRIMAPHLSALSTTLVITALFDREVNCRRAAAAAFQEHVGRQGSFEHGIAIVQAINYFTVAVRADTYVPMAVDMSQRFGERYAAPLIEHLVGVKSAHWDDQVRTLCADALGALAQRGGESVAHALGDGTLQRRLVAQSTSRDAGARHGAMLALSRIIARVDCDEQLAADIAEVPARIDAERLCRGANGHLVRLAACRLAEAVAERRWPHEHFEAHLRLVEQTLKHPDEAVESAAADAIAALSSAHRRAMARRVAGYRRIVERDCSVVARRGYALALGALDAELFQDATLELLLRVADRAQPFDADTRRNAVRALHSIGARAAFNDGGKRKRKIVDALLGALDDYTCDKRGDVGSWSRTAAMHALDELLPVELDSPSQSDVHRREFARHLVRAAGERLGRLRALAVDLLGARAQCWPDELAALELASEPSALFESLARMACRSTGTFAEAALDGLASSAGAVMLTSPCVARDALLGALASLDAVEARNGALQSLARIVHRAASLRQHNRYVPLLRTLDAVLRARPRLGASLQPPAYSVSLNFVRVTRSLMRQGVADIGILRAAVPVLCELVVSFAKPTRTHALRLALALLEHRYPRIRHHAAQRLFTALSQMADVDQDTEQLKALVAETRWLTIAKSECRQSLSTIYDLCGFKTSAAASSSSSAAPTPQEANDGDTNNKKKSKDEVDDEIVHHVGF
jgi:tubulin-specific chaperone D